MRDSRDSICAALQSIGGHHVPLLAQDALRRAGLDDDPDPRRLITALDYSFHRLTRAPFRAEVHGREIAALWDADEGGLNALIGLAIAELGTTYGTATPADVYRLAGWLAMPEGMSTSPHLPDWFIDGFFRKRTSMIVPRSGVRPAIRLAR